MNKISGVAEFWDLLQGARGAQSCKFLRMRAQFLLGHLHPKNGPVSFQKCLKMFCFHYVQVFTRCCFQNMSVRVPFSKSTVFKICRQKMCHFRVNGRPIRQIFHRFQNVPASCERSLSWLHKFDCLQQFDWLQLLQMLEH